MDGLILIVFAAVVLGGAYFTYGKFLERKWGVDKNAVTPAYQKEDGVDYIPTPKLVVFAHQFSSIAGAGPVTGPIIAAMFGWAPVLGWVLIGSIFFGAVQDFGSLYASVKNEGKSIGLLIEKYIGKTGRKLFLLFSWLFTLLVIAAFSDIVATQFNGFSVVDGVSSTVPQNAAAASISLLFIVGAIVFGLFIKKFKPSEKVQFVIGIALLVAMLGLGMVFPIFSTKNIWMLVVFAYLFIASVMPMWLLMQPRDYLSSFMLIGMIVGAVIGIFVARPTMNLNAFNGFSVDGRDMFPTLFITIACGAVSGFHSLVSSGTSSKTIRNEKDSLFVGFGAMMVEGLLSVIALVVVGGAAIGGVMPSGTPFQIFTSNIAGFLTIMGFNEYVAVSFMTMCVSALALTSLDSVARIGRMSFQELFMGDTTDRKQMSAVQRVLTNKYVATVITLFAGYMLALGGYMNVWPLFGAANQLLSALVLIALAVFLRTTQRQGWMLYIPMTIMLAVTSTSLVQSVITIIKKLTVTHDFVMLVDGLQLIVALLLMTLATLVVLSCFRKLVEKPESVEIKAHPESV